MRKLHLVGSVTAVLLALDVVTKWVVQRSFHLGESLPVAGDVLRFTYILNPGAAFGLSVGSASRWVFATLAVLASALIVAIIRQTPGTDRARLVALAMILGGAAGNLLDRLRHPGGVVDFLDVGFAGYRWPVFNVADVGVVTGAFLLVVLLWGEDVAAERAEGRGPAVAADSACPTDGTVPGTGTAGAAGAAGP